KARNEETLKGIRQEAESRVKLARAEANRVAAIISAGLSAGELSKADLSGHVRLAIVALGRQFGIAGSGLREAAQELADELNRLRAKTRQQSSQISESLRAAFANIRARKFAAQIEGLSGSSGGPRVSGPQDIKLDVLAAMLQQDFQISGTNLKNAVVAFINEFNKLRNQRVANEQRFAERQDALRARLLGVEQKIVEARNKQLAEITRNFGHLTGGGGGGGGGPPAPPSGPPSGPPPPDGPKNLKDIARFTSRLNPEEQERFARALRKQAAAASTASRAMKAHN